MKSARHKLIVSQLCEALRRWGVSLIQCECCCCDIATLVYLACAYHTVCIEVELFQRQALKNVRRNFKNHAVFNIVVAPEEAIRNAIARKLRRFLSEQQWDRTLVIAPDQIYAALRWIESHSTELEFVSWVDVHDANSPADSSIQFSVVTGTPDFAGGATN